MIVFILRRRKQTRVEAIIDQGLQYDGNAPGISTTKTGVGIEGGGEAGAVEDEIPSVFPRLKVERREKQA